MNGNFEKQLGYTFKDKSLIQNALAHSSYANEKKIANNERLEFLGDSVLSIIVSEQLYKRMPDVDEGRLTKVRASLVCEQSLAVFAKKVGIREAVLLGHGEEITGGRSRASILSDAFEAVLAAIFLDSDMDTAKKWLLNIMDGAITSAAAGHIHKDYKTALQEAVQKGHTGRITYRTIGESGPDHKKTFIVEVMRDGVVMNTGEGSSKKDAEQNAAKTALENLR